MWRGPDGAVLGERIKALGDKVAEGLGAKMDEPLREECMVSSMWLLGLPMTTEVVIP